MPRFSKYAGPEFTDVQREAFTLLWHYANGAGVETLRRDPGAVLDALATARSILGERAPDEYATVEKAAQVAAGYHLRRAFIVLVSTYPNAEKKLRS